MLIAWSVARAACPDGAVDLLTGHWHGRASDEHWVPVDDGLVGLSLEPASFELLWVSRRGGYTARPGGGPSTTFPCVHAEPGRVSFEDPAHDWPTRVAYGRDARGLRARVDADGGPVLQRRWRSFAPEGAPLTFPIAPASTLRAWWGERALGPGDLAAVEWEVHATARRSDWVGAVGRATLEGDTRPFAAVWRATSDPPELVAFAGF